MLNETNIFQFFILNKQNKNEEPLYFNETTKRYIDIKFIQWNNNYTIGESKFEEVKAKKCEPKDFEKFKIHELKTLSDGYSMICPDVRDNETQLLLKGGSQNDVSKYYEFAISKCVNKTDNGFSFLKQDRSIYSNS